MSEYWEKYKSFVNDKTERERLILLLVLLAATFVIIDALLTGELIKKRAQQSKTLASVERDMDTLQLELQNLQLGQSAIGSQLQQEAEKLQATNQQLEEALRSAAAGFIPAQQMPIALEEMLGRSDSLALVSLENKPVQLLSGEPGDPHSLLYRHGVKIVLKGTYVASMDYLKQLEQLQWRIEWDAMRFEVKDYPAGELTIDVSTYSKEKDWIGV
ncbi:MAG: hypothetical protein KJP25_05595 [Gammaproteobacteria bacterium]|nr:hypothetical protein [Gammaproteobacteria bacterium]NND39972.1 hypothetical protein [Pseudomonadales bacterium]NNL11593.1 hypothetical protein [Pseudomonadales bacterium]NNM10999.1 hypothetical protein [Pseudomonadales bacterium]RZV60077.1 MAG: hypothetical protein EX270_00730 [Pseudomonadales bacterium]